MSTSRGRSFNQPEQNTQNGGRVDAALKATLITLYKDALKSDDIYFSFEEGPLRIQELFHIIITNSSNLQWPIDKEELARVWHQPFLIPPGTQASYYRTHTTDDERRTPCQDTVLNAALINLHAENIEIQTPSFPNPRARVNIILQQPTHEVYISTFWHDWVRGLEGYMKRVLIPHPYAISTLLLSSKTVGRVGVRYSVTILPHIHQAARRFHATINPAHSELLPHTINCTRQHINPARTGTTCIISNSMKSNFPTVRSILYNLLHEENPHIVIVLGSSIDASEIPPMACSSENPHIVKVDAEGYEPGMFIIWRPNFVNLTKLPSNTACINMLIEPEVPDNHYRGTFEGMSSNTN